MGRGRTSAVGPRWRSEWLDKMRAPVAAAGAAAGGGEGLLLSPMVRRGVDVPPSA